MTPKVSVVLPASGGRSDLEARLGKALDQSLGQIEIIVAQPASAPSDAQDLVKSIQSKDKRVRHITTSDFEGTGKAREAGIAAAIGEYVGFLDLDYDPDSCAFELLYSAATQCDCDIAVAASLASPRKVEAGWDSNISEPTKYCISGQELFDRQVRGLRAPYVLGVDWGNKIYRRSLFIENSVSFPSTTCAEQIMTTVLSVLAEKCVIVDAALFTAPEAVKGRLSEFDQSEFDERIASVLHTKEWLKRVGAYSRERESAFVDIVYAAILNDSLKRIASMSKKSQSNLSNKLLKNLTDRSDTKIDLYKYLSAKHRSAERQAFAQLLEDELQPETVLNLAWSDTHGRLEGGVRARQSDRRSINRPLVSIVTVAKDVVSQGRASYFEQMVASVQGQDYGRRNIEHIVVDSSSRDGSLQLYQEAALDYWISEYDSGIYNAMNKGLELCRGDYILFMNTDDYLEPSAVSDLVSALDSSGADYSYGHATKIDMNDQKVGEHKGDIRKIYFGAPYCHQALLCRRSVYEKIKYDESYKLTMWSFALGLYLAGYKGARLDKFIVNFRVGGESTAASIELFQAEQNAIRATILAPMLGLSFEELEFVRSAWRRVPTAQLGLKTDCVVSSLVDHQSESRIDFLRCVFGLLLDHRANR